MPFEVFEHTADIGVHVASSTLEQLFADASCAVASLIVENPEAVEPRQSVALAIEAENLEGLFVDWLRELIYRFETEHLLLRECSVELSDGNRRLQAHCRGEPADWTRHHPDNELKAVTYHQFRIVQTPAGWEADVIFDI